jgi:hypothetical protein
LKLKKRKEREIDKLHIIQLENSSASGPFNKIELDPGIFFC